MKNIPPNLEMLMVLAGEDKKQRPRSNKAIGIYHEYGRLPFLLSGSHSGLHYIKLPEGIKPQSYEMREYALRNGIKDEDIIIQDKSMDTLADFYFSRLENLIPEKGLVGIVSDPAHEKRSLYCAKKVFEENPEFRFIPSDQQENLKIRINEFVLRMALKYDLSNIKNGDITELTQYIQHINPFHALAYGNIPEFSYYGLIAKTAKKLTLTMRKESN